jgi:hypothetical protein
MKTVAEGGRRRPVRPDRRAWPERDDVLLVAINTATAELPTTLRP